MFCDTNQRFSTWTKDNQARHPLHSIYYLCPLDVLISIFQILSEIPSESQKANDFEKERIFQFSSILFSLFSEIAQSLEFSPHESDISRMYISLLRKALLTLSLWVNTPILSCDIDGAEETENRNNDSWVTFQQLSSLVIVIDSDNKINFGEQWEGSVIYSIGSHVFPFLMSILVQKSGNTELLERAIECTSTMLEFLSGILLLAQPERQNSAFSQFGLWSIFTCLDQIVNLQLYSIGFDPPFTTSNFQNNLIEVASREPLCALPVLVRILSSFCKSTEQSFHFHLAECVAVIIERHLVIINACVFSK